ncbi:MAG: Fic family protein [Trebonia sp.]
MASRPGRRGSRHRDLQLGRPRPQALEQKRSFRTKAAYSGRPAAPATAPTAMAHLNLVMIHPFRDGNGRMARALTTPVLARSDIGEPDPTTAPPSPA